MPLVCETVRRRKDGSLLDISLSVSPIQNAEGRIIGASKIARDITRRKQIETELLDAKEALAKELERRVKERTVDLELANMALREQTEEHKGSKSSFGKLRRWKASAHWPAVWKAN